MSPSILKVVTGLSLREYSRFYVTMLKAFVDDSGSGGDSPWVVLAGYVGTEEDWTAFDSEWQEVLDEPPSLAYFKSSEAESLKGRFSGFTRNQRNVRIDRFISVIQKRARQAIEVRMRLSHYDSLIRGNVPTAWDDPYYFLFSGFILSATTVERLYGEESPIEFVFDSSERFEKPSTKFFESFRTRYDQVTAKANVAYRDDKLFLPLQAADLLAWQVRRLFCSNEPRRQHLTDARKTKWEHFSHIVGKEELTKMKAALAKRQKIMTEQFGLDEDVRKWKL